MGIADSVKKKGTAYKKSHTMTCQKLICLVAAAIIIIGVSICVGSVGTFYGNMAASNGAIVQCPLVQNSFANNITFSSPTVHHFPNSDDVTILYSMNGQETTIPLSSNQHSLGEFTEGSTMITLTAMDSVGNRVACHFTYTRTPIPVIVCPSPDKNGSASISFDSPVLRNFPNPERVNISYSKSGKLIVTLPVTSPQHELDDFDVGTTMVTAVASDSRIFISCEFEYIRIPVMQCRDSLSSTSISLSIPTPTTNFVVTSSYYYFRKGVLSAVAPSSAYLLYFDRGHSTEITISATDSLGNSATCSFTFNVTSAESGSASFRLVGGHNIYEGRVEVYHDGVWGTVCDDSWDTDDAIVVCRRLGFPYQDVLSRSLAYFGQGSGKIWLDNVACFGTETYLYSCDHPGWGVEDCGHEQDAGVICTDGEYSTSRRHIRLVDGSNPNEGRVEVHYNGIWGTVCHGSWDVSDAIVVCRQLGLPYGAVKAYRSSHFGGGTGEIWMNNVKCRGTEAYLSDCAHHGWGATSSYCDSHNSDAGVICTDGFNYVRLEGGINTHQGRVEVLHNGVWGTVCSDSWDTTNARVVCRQLGLPYDAAVSVTDAKFGPGTGEIWMDNVNCDGSEDHIGNCGHNGWSTHNCTHNRDAGVICK
ncbi:neurotrypsin-like [Amphiura filiformis]|uniref:neurotrypsin-like n=1 Tax=Amphiura filiformis TaxID=82378 RepID=UPI003B21F414